MNQQPAYFAVIPADVRYAPLKPNAKLLYGEITALCNVEGYCWADNAYFAKLYSVGTETISRWISQLRDHGFIDVEILQKEGNARRITIDEKVKRSCQKKQEVLSKKAIPLVKKGKPIYENNTINNTTNREKGALAFLESDFPTRFESWLTQHKTKIGTDFQKFAADFDDTVTIEKLEWDPDILFARLNKYARNWEVNMQRGDKAARGVINMQQPAMQGGNRIEVKRRG